MKNFSKEIFQKKNKKNQKINYKNFRKNDTTTSCIGKIKLAKISENFR